MENKVSVRTLVETIMVCGDISSAGSVQRMQEGARGHRRLQGEYGEKARSEVAVALDVPGEEMPLHVHGRIDVLWSDGAGKPCCVEEIKTTRRDPTTIEAEEYPLHWAQAECYAHMLCVLHNLPGMQVRLTYLHVDDKGRAYLVRDLSAEELQRRFDALAHAYQLLLIRQRDWQALRDETIGQLPFPFAGYRKGQREMAAQAYLAVRDGARLLAEAPTGIGKTVAMLFSSLKAMGEGHAGRIFYLTARGPTQRAAQEAMEMLATKGLRARWITLAAKEKMCACPGAACDPMECPRAKGHYDRLQKAMDKALLRDGHTPEDNRAIGNEFEICPFEFALDLSLHCDVIIGDYNYAFDPRAKLRRYFMDKNDFALLLDEAHNLPDRAREMFSAALQGDSMRRLRREVGRASRKIPLYRHMGKAIKAVEAGEVTEELTDALYKLADGAEDLFGEQFPFHGDLLDCYFAVRGFLDAAENRAQYPEDFAVLPQPKGLRIFCANPAPLLNQCYELCGSAVLFSATMHPLPYMGSICGCGEEARRIRMTSPFPPENLQVLIRPLPTRYTMREESLTAVAAAIAAMGQGRESGNYFVFFPSYAYMLAVLPLVAELLPQAELLVQQGGMDEDGRRAYLQRFEHNEGLLMAFAVMGGLFGEGIDLPGDRLCGAAIVGVGLPQVCAERDTLRERFNAEGDGFAYAYQYPGMARVAQAAGRVIRTMEDRGVVLLIDERFTQSRYRELMPPHWSPGICHSAADVKAACVRFWG